MSRLDIARKEVIIRKFGTEYNKMHIYHGWHEWTDKSADYYPEPTHDAFDQAIRVMCGVDSTDPDMKNTAIFFARGERKGSVHTLPAHIKTMDEAKAWALAVWRMG